MTKRKVDITVVRSLFLVTSKDGISSMSQRILVEVLSRSNHTNTILRSVFNDVTRKSNMFLVMLVVSSELFMFGMSISMLAIIISISLSISTSGTYFLIQPVISIISLRVLDSSISYRLLSITALGLSVVIYLSTSRIISTLISI